VAETVDAVSRWDDLPVSEPDLDGSIVSEERLAEEAGVAGW
jgi:hypothetical protein